MSKEFEIARLSVLNLYLSGHFSNQEARIYAWSRRVYPIHPRALESAFASDFQVPEGDVDAVSKWLDTRWLAKTPTTFYDMEQAFSASWTPGARSVGRAELIAICRQASLDSLFDQAFLAGLLVSAPTEAHGFNDPFDPRDDVEL